MPSVRFTRNIQRHVECPTREVEGSTLREVFDAYFSANEQARGYVLDDRGQLRKHMAASPGVSDEKRYPVDGRVVVNRTRDGGKTFEPITRGLPQSHAYDLVYRHALDVDDSGQTLSSNLPPVYAVRFEKRA